MAAKIPSPLFGRNGLIDGIRLTTPPNSSSATITFNKPGLSEAYRQFDAARQAIRTSPIEPPAFKAIRVQVPGNQALQLLNDFKTYLEKNPLVALTIPDHLHLLEGRGFVKGASVSMPSNSNLATIIFEKPGLAEAYQEFSASRHRPFTPVGMQVPKDQGKKLVNDFRAYLHNTSSLRNSDAWINGVTLFTPSDNGPSTISFNKPGIFEAYQEFNASRPVVISDPVTLKPLITQDVTSGEMFHDIIKKFKHRLSEIREEEPKPEEQEYSAQSNHFSFGSR